MYQWYNISYQNKIKYNNNKNAQIKNSDVAIQAMKMKLKMDCIN